MLASVDGSQGRNEPMANVARGQTIADRAVHYLRITCTPTSAGAIANAIGESLRSTQNALYRYRTANPNVITQDENGFWHLRATNETLTQHDAIASSVSVEHDVEPLGDGEESVDDILVGVITDLLEAAAQLESVRARRSALMVRVRDRITEMLTSEE